MDRDLFKARSMQIALGMLVLTLTLAAWTGARAYRIPRVAPSAPPAFATALTRTNIVVPADVGAAVAMNLFSQQRKAPAVRYRLNGYSDGGPVTPPPQPVVLGTFVSTGNRSFAYASVADTRATVVRVGDLLGGYTVKSIERGLVVFSTPSGERLVITAK